MLRFAQHKDIPAIMEFIENHWKHGHILARNRSFFEYFYGTATGVHFAISQDNTGHINGIIGYVAYDSRQKYISLALWKALPSQESFIGLDVFAYLLKELQPDLVATLGVNVETSGDIYRFFDYELGKMQHWYRLAPQETYSIARIQERHIPPAPPQTSSLRKLMTVSEIPDTIVCDSQAIPKTKRYLQHRYFDHPIFTYTVYLVDTDMLVVTRVQTYHGSRCLRIVDMIGNYAKLPHITAFFDHYLACNALEYMDCYTTGLPAALFHSAGFTEIHEQNNIIPEYFSPYLCKNIDIYYSSSRKNSILFKGDGDMDRPA